MRKRVCLLSLTLAACAPTPTTDTSALEQLEIPARPTAQPPQPQAPTLSREEQMRALARQENPDGSVTHRIAPKVAGMAVPLEYTVDAATRALPEYGVALAYAADTFEQLNALPADSPDRATRLCAHIEALATVRLVLRDAGDRDAAFAFAVSVLAALTELDDTTVMPVSTSLVATFPDAGEGYCNRVTRGIRDQILQVNAFTSCTTDEFNAFLALEVRADQGRGGTTERCESVAWLEDGFGSYQLLVECLQREGQL